MTSTRRSLRPLFRLRGATDDRTIDLVVPDESTAIVGAASVCDLVVDHRNVSRRHAELGLNNGRLTIRDLESKNGTFVNGRRIGRSDLKEGDEVHFGSVKLAVELVEPADVEVVINLAGTAVATVNDRSAITGTRSEMGRDSALAVRWLETLQAMVIEHDPLDPASRMRVLKILHDGLEAAGLAFVYASTSGEPVIEAAVGAPLPLGRLTELSPGSGTDDAADPPVLWTACRGGDGVILALCAVGDFPGRKQCGELLRAAGQLLADVQPGKNRGKRKEQTELSFPDGHVVGGSPSAKALYEELHQLVQGDIPVLITGETGVGKEHVARILHLSSERRGGPFVAVNCAAIPSELLEAELFGIAGGVATGVDAREGKLRLADSGVVFLDEVGDMTPALQAKLLRALQEREVHPVGAEHALPFDARVLSATNLSVEDLLGDTGFRRDLFYRIAGYTVVVPSLRRRRDDLGPLLEHFLRRSAAEVGKTVRGLSTRAFDALSRYDWPGNLRELEHEARRLVYRCPNRAAIEFVHLSEAIRRNADEGRSGTDPDLDLRAHVARVEREVIAAALTRADGNKSKAAKLLGLSRNGLLLKLERLGLL